MENQNNNNEMQQAVTAALDEQKKKKRKRRLIIFAVIIVVIIAIAALSSGGDDSSSSQAGNNNSAETTSQVSADKEAAVDGKIGNYVCVVKKAEICKNWEGKDAVKITYAFTNNNTEAESFDIALTDNVYQDGVGLESTFISSDDDDWGIDVKIKPGVTKEVAKVYVLRDKTTDLEVEIGELFSFDDTKVKTTVKLQ
ncbi:MAG: DUF5067 domain-containing protein [Eubacterium sp.]|nr:DUF5067 domain-containing protein [Eubacterium sp.]